MSTQRCSLINALCSESENLRAFDSSNTWRLYFSRFSKTAGPISALKFAILIGVGSPNSADAPEECFACGCTLYMPVFCLKYIVTTSAKASLPSHALAQGGDVGGVMFSMPRIQRERPIERHRPVLGMAKGAIKIRRLHGAQHDQPAAMQVIKRAREVSTGVSRLSGSCAHSFSS